MMNELAQEIHADSVAHGWYDQEDGVRPFPEIIALIHTEASEAFESWRKQEDSHYLHENGKPDGWGVEFADIIIRVLDACAYYGLDIERLLREKVDYNKTREHKHGGKLV